MGKRFTTNKDNIHFLIINGNEDIYYDSKVKVDFTP
jgi:hypothetical protein